MFALFSNNSDLTGIPLKAYSVKFSLDRLTPGVDNIRHDVLLSPDFCKSIGKLILCISEEMKSSILSDRLNKMLLLYSWLRPTEVKSLVSAENTMLVEDHDTIMTRIRHQYFTKLMVNKDAPRPKQLVHLTRQIQPMNKLRRYRQRLVLNLLSGNTCRRQNRQRCHAH